MEENIEENKQDVEKGSVQDKAPEMLPETKLKKVEPESKEETFEKEFRIEVQTILEKLKSLPSEAAEMKIPGVTRNVKEVYSKLCKALKVSENSTILLNIENEKMDFSYQCLGPVGIIPVAKALTLSNTLKEIDLKYNKLGVKSLPAVTLLVDQNENIAHLNLSSNGIGKGSAHMLSELINRCFSIEFLDLSNNDLGDEELQEIGVALMKLDCVKELVLSTNDFSSAKAPVFGSCISKCSALLRLDLSGCHLQEGVTTIFSGLKISNLTVLNLAKNGIPDEAIPALAFGLRANKSLQELNISYNAISNKGAIALAPGLRGSSTLEVIKLAHNPIQGSAATVLLNSVGGNFKILDLSGIRVNLAFFKTLRSYARAGKEVRVLFGSEIRYDCFPRDFTVPEDGALSKDNAVSYLGKLADEKGVSLRNALKNVHATFIAEQHAEISEAQADKKKAEKMARPEMSVQDFAKGLAESQLAVSKALAIEVAELLSEEGFVNMWQLIARVRWRPDDLNVKIKDPRKPQAEKPKGKEKK